MKKYLLIILILLNTQILLASYIVKSTGALIYKSDKKVYDSQILTKAYNSKLFFKDNILGNHWFFTFEKRLLIEEGSLVFIDPVNPEYRIFFKQNFIAPHLVTTLKNLRTKTLESYNTYITLKVMKNTFVVKNKTTGIQYFFNTKGKIIKIIEKDATYTFSYQNKFLSSILKNGEVFFELSYGLDGLKTTKYKDEIIHYSIENKNLTDIYTQDIEMIEGYGYENQQLSETSSGNSMEFFNDGKIKSWSIHSKHEYSYEEGSDYLLMLEELENGTSRSYRYIYKDKKKNILESLLEINNENQLITREVNFKNNRSRTILEDGVITTLRYNENGLLEYKDDENLYLNLEYDKIHNKVTSIRIGNDEKGVLEWISCIYTSEGFLSEVYYANYEEVHKSRKILFTHNKNLITKIFYQEGSDALESETLNKSKIVVFEYDNDGEIVNFEVKGKGFLKDKEGNFHISTNSVSKIVRKISRESSKLMKYIGSKQACNCYI